VKKVLTGTAQGKISVSAAQSLWSGAASNRRPSAFQAHPQRHWTLLDVA